MQSDQEKKLGELGLGELPGKRMKLGGLSCQRGSGRWISISLRIVWSTQTLFQKEKKGVGERE